MCAIINNMNIKQISCYNKFKKIIIKMIMIMKINTYYFISRTIYKIFSLLNCISYQYININLKKKQKKNFYYNTNIYLYIECICLLLLFFIVLKQCKSLYFLYF